MTDFIKPTLTFDIEEFQHHLDGSNLTDAEKEELLKTLWEIICEFVFLGFGVHPVDHLREDLRRKTLKIAEMTDQKASDPVTCDIETACEKRVIVCQKQKGVK